MCHNFLYSELWLVRVCPHMNTDILLPIINFIQRVVTQNLGWNQFGGGTFLGNLAVRLGILLCNSQAGRLNPTLPRNCLQHLKNPLCCGVGGCKYCLRLSPSPVHLVYLCSFWLQYHRTPLPMCHIRTDFLNLLQYWLNN